MTMPLERTSSLLEARSFLNSLRSNSEVSEEVKRQAERLLRHYPSAREVMQLAAKEDYIRQVASSVLPHSFSLSAPMTLVGLRNWLTRTGSFEHSGEI